MFNQILFKSMIWDHLRGCSDRRVAPLCHQTKSNTFSDRPFSNSKNLSLSFIVRNLPVSPPQGKYPFRGEKQLESGFSILEVLVTILVVSGFLLGSLQATVLATLLRVQAQDKQQAANWVQQDLELIRYEAFVLDSGAPDPTTCTASTYGTRLRDTINTSYSTNGGVQINNKWYRVFRQYIPSENILQVNYTLAYSPATTSIPNPAHPRYNSSASYTVTGAAPTGNANVVATLSAEVIPNAALSCP